MTVRFKPWLDQLPEYVAGRTIEEIKKKYNLENVYKLASNENIFGPCCQVKEFIKNNAAKGVNYYPDSDCREIRGKIASVFDVLPENVILGNGTDQIIEMICDCFVNEDENVVIADPTFLIYEKAALKCGGIVIKIPLKDFRQDITKMADSVNANTRIFFLTSPHNPTGTNITKEEFENVMGKISSNILIVMDEAYHEYLSEGDKIDTVAYTKKYSNLITLRTFSKAYGLAGLRIGYGIADSEIISGLNKIRLPFNVSSIAQKTALIALENKGYVNDIRDKILKEKEKFYSVFKTEGINFIKSYSNFILIRLGEKNTEITEELLKNGFIIRPGENLGIPGYMRVTISIPEINDKFLNAFIRIYKNYYS
ncbi:MAG: histidinol-phosphate transaminase [Actinobacteria bacterium]|nr:histidinol-phosphate transaminase [Actinomycetota bacterium]